MIIIPLLPLIIILILFILILIIMIIIVIIIHFVTYYCSYVEIISRPIYVPDDATYLPFLEWSYKGRPIVLTGTCTHYFSDP